MKHRTRRPPGRSTARRRSRCRSTSGRPATTSLRARIRDPDFCAFFPCGHFFFDRLRKAQTVRLTDAEKSGKVEGNQSDLWDSERRTLAICNNSDLYAESGQTLQASFSAVSKPKFASNYSLESSCRDLHNQLLCTAL